MYFYALTQAGIGNLKIKAMYTLCEHYRMAHILYLHLAQILLELNTILNKSTPLNYQLNTEIQKPAQGRASRDWTIQERILNAQSYRGKWL